MTTHFGCAAWHSSILIPFREASQSLEIGYAMHKVEQFANTHIALGKFRGYFMILL